MKSPAEIVKERVKEDKIDAIAGRTVEIGGYTIGGVALLVLADAILTGGAITGVTLAVSKIAIGIGGLGCVFIGFLGRTLRKGAEGNMRYNEIP